jgi:hypothetical protein
MRKCQGALLTALLLCGCLGTESKREAEWNGIALRSCGPADGPAIEFLIDSLPLDCSSSRAVAFRVYAGWYNLDSLPPVLSISSEPSILCDGKSDPVAEEMRLDLSDRDSVGIKAHFRRIRTYPCTEAKTRPDTLEGVTRLKICREGPGPMCG